MEVFENYDLTSHNSYKIKASCRRAFFPSSESDFLSIYQSHPDSKKVILGGGYNIILSKPYYDEDFILLNEGFANVKVTDGHIMEVEAGANTIRLSELAWEHGLTGMEIFYDIPSSLGGAVVMNAGASGEEIKDILTKVRYLDLADLKVREIKKEDIGFEYRNSFFQKNVDKIVLKAWLQLAVGDKAAIKEKMDRVKEARWAKQPKEFPNAGSVFKRPPGFYVGQMIEELGLKGFSVGGAKVSEKHGGFIINHASATGADILELINIVKHKVHSKFGVELEVEQRVI
ncbi:UDP-N-acetylmuramate dehydrogenase [Imperialibacter roseus]|uniref:UDP-N-acetylenolpyruvoylglucosamine reductase n=1 Tax=Imperialibacter roseus TaxID=1324217 RepID=A0ABZ0IK24_9BACT|nr:UDP-N-acetylmuramate dehydrogenase [Imperialibacter roseus]WOK05373.1 UDP-N-acetylmuramate dehydrogenase [Imperialibacter roseus]